MNKHRILRSIGKILLTEVLLMIPSLLVSFIYGEGDSIYFLVTMIPAAVIGFILSHVKVAEKRMGSRDAYYIVALAWIVISVIGAFPLYFSGCFDSYWGALFEMVSGITTTGASVLAKPELLPHGVLFWRSFTHWIGGMGVLVFVLMLMPMENDNSMHLVRAEVPGPTASKLVPKMKTTAMILYGIYAAMTVLLLVLLLLGGMPLFDALCISFGTAGTGGFATSSAGIAGYKSAYMEVVIGIFMMLFSINFNVYFFLLLRKVKEAFNTEEVKWYIGIVAFSTIAIACNTCAGMENIGKAARNAFFQVTSIISTTGFATVDYNLWPEFSKHLLVLLMIIGACSGSTGGGLKVSRVIILVKSFLAEIRHIASPKTVSIVRLNKKGVDKETLIGTRNYMAAYFIIICLITLIIAIDGFDLTTNLTAVLSCFNNIGPGLNAVGPVENFGGYSDWVQVLLSFVMLTGRLEIFPMFILLSRSSHHRIGKRGI